MPGFVAIPVLSILVALLLAAAWLLLCAAAIAALAPFLSLGGALAFVAAVHAMLAIATILMIKAIARAAARRRRSAAAARLLGELAATLFRIGRRNRFETGLFVAVGSAFLVALLTTPSDTE